MLLPIATAAAMAPREYTPLEVQRIQVACTLLPSAYTTQRLEIFGQMLEEGHIKICTQAVMREL
jgi:hypothetical protein